MPDANQLGATSVAPADNEKLFVNRESLVDKREEKPVPNYFLETKIFNKVKRNAIVEAHPSVLQFAGFTPGQPRILELRLANISTEVTRFHIIPPETKYFKIHYKKNERLVPGFAVDCTVEFMPDEMRYYYDAVRIHSQDEDNNLVIPIHAYPILGENNFPAQLKFPVIPVGYRKTKIVPIRSCAPVEFEFTLTILHDSPAFEVEPLAGVIPANGEVDIAITFSPTDFVTAQMTIQLSVSQFEFQPMICHVMGYSAPGLERNKIRMEHQLFEEGPPPPITLDPRTVSPLARARQKRTSKQYKSNPPGPQPEKPVERDGFRIPARLDCPTAVSNVLNQEPGKLNMKELREALEKKTESSEATRQMKEALFEQEVRQDVYDERQNQLRWQVRLGDEPMTPRQRGVVKEQEKESREKYHHLRGDPVIPEEMKREVTGRTSTRTRRQGLEEPSADPQFDLFTNDKWAARKANLFQFQQAARTAIVRQRADHKLAGLRDLVLDWGKGKYSTVVTGEMGRKQGEQEETEKKVMNSSKETLVVEHIGSVTFPTHEAPSVVAGSSAATLEQIKVPTTEIVLRHTYPYYSLRVPQHYRLHCYDKVEVHGTRGYVPVEAARPLRTGALDEIISLTAAPGASDLVLEDLETAPRQERIEGPVEVILRPPNTLFQPLEYPPLHIFNPAPGLQVFTQPQPYSETDSDFRLCPLPRYVARTTEDQANNPFMTNQRNYLDREDTIRGLTTWKKFPSQGLTALANCPTLTNVWVPRWCDPFSEDMLPTSIPNLQQGLDEYDAENIIIDDAEPAEEVTLTPEMVSAAFPAIGESSTSAEATAAAMMTPAQQAIAAQQAAQAAVLAAETFPFGSRMPASNLPVSSRGPVQRWDREREMEFFLERRANRMGSRMATRITLMDNTLNNKDLSLK